MSELAFAGGVTDAPLTAKARVYHLMTARPHVIQRAGAMGTTQTAMVIGASCTMMEVFMMRGEQVVQMATMTVQSLAKMELETRIVGERVEPLPSSRLLSSPLSRLVFSFPFSSLFPRLHIDPLICAICAIAVAYHGPSTDFDLC